MSSPGAPPCSSALRVFVRRVPSGLAHCGQGVSPAPCPVGALSPVPGADPAGCGLTLPQLVLCCVVLGPSAPWRAQATTPGGALPCRPGAARRERPCPASCPGQRSATRVGACCGGRGSAGGGRAGVPAQTGSPPRPPPRVLAARGRGREGRVSSGRKGSGPARRGDDRWVFERLCHEEVSGSASCVHTSGQNRPVSPTSWSQCPSGLRSWPLPGCRAVRAGSASRPRPPAPSQAPGSAPRPFPSAPTGKEVRLGSGPRVAAPPWEPVRLAVVSVPMSPPAGQAGFCVQTGLRPERQP